MLGPKKSAIVLTAIAVVLCLSLFVHLYQPNTAIAQPVNVLNISIIGPEKIPYNQPTTYTASVDGTTYGKVTYTWSISPDNDSKTLLQPNGDSCTLTYIQPTTDPYTLKVEVKDEGKGFGVGIKTVMDPATFPNVYLGVYGAPYSYMVCVDESGAYYYAINGKTGRVEWSSTDVNTVLNSAAQSNSIVDLAPKTFYGNLVIDGISNFTLRCNGAKIIPTSDTPVIKVGVTTYTYNVQISNVIIDGGSNTANLISIGCPTAFAEKISISDSVLTKTTGYAVAFQNATFGNVVHNVIEKAQGVFCNSSCNDNHIINNRIYGDLSLYPASPMANGVLNYADGTIITENAIALYTNGIYSYGNRCPISNNLMDLNAIGIYMTGAYAVGNSITSNICNQDGLTGIFLNGCQQVTVTANECGDSGQTSASYAGILIVSSSNNTIANNICGSVVTSTYGKDSQIGIALRTNSLNNIITGNILKANLQYGIQLDNTSGYNLISNNLFSENTLAPVQVLSTNNIFATNIGFVTSNSGTASNTTALTCVFAHGLASTATVVTVTGNSPALNYAVTAINATHVTVTASGTPTGASWAIFWRAEYKP